MKSLVFSSHLGSRTSPATPIEEGLLEGLCRKGIDLIVYAPQGKDKSFKSNLNVVFTHLNMLIIHMFGLVGRVFPDLVWLPDSMYFAWGIGARRKAEKQINRDNIDFIFSFGFANACHWICCKLKRKKDIPWVATFFDSWTDYPTRIFRTSFFRRIDQKMESEVALRADIIIHDNENIAEIWRKRYGEIIARKIVVIPLPINFGPESSSKLCVENKKVLNISHIGTFYEYRDATMFIKAVKRFADLFPSYRNCIRVNFVGTVLSRDIELIHRYSLDDVFNIVGRVTPEECKSYYINSDIFLSTTGNLGEQVMFPSKIIKYFFYDRPILGIAEEGTITKIELNKAGHQTFSAHEQNAIATYIYNAIEDYKSLCSYDHDYWKKFDSQKVCEQYYNTIVKFLNK